ncbi:Uracil permease [Lysinibacillus irui]|uniref:Uracil permease n=1 Tax=Lysinibacillus irui TaxID=2998077 RepID=A0AAJ5UQH4_9BACI|nr:MULTISPECIES: Uracil permease [Lysinibacillus]MEA0554976.1 Uracil permease [Lysinibacillus irui]MEA0565721.1 Uracil permease [Lysinibacillus irui]MEA0976691.1 Uracil permease [Lysinibacillus irui]MEA1042845.1 Uracil permease [Lysinibacillus irui]WDV05606.1 Uracil permease [Lysinibacillus irui]
MSEQFINQIQPCPVTSTEQIPLTNEITPLVTTPLTTPTIKIPVVLAEPTLQIVVESDITLSPAATEIKRVKKHVFLNQVKLVPVSFARIAGTDFFRVTRAKLFVAGHIRKNIEYASSACNGALQDRIADVPFSGFTELFFPQATGGATPILGISEFAEANFLNERTQMDARLDKAFFQNLVKYNEQPFGELVAANFFELDFSPIMAAPEEAFSTLREKIVLELTVKVLQVQQIRLGAGSSVVTPVLPGLTPPATPIVPEIIPPTESC